MITMAKTVFIVYFFTLCGICCEGLDFTLDHYGPDLSAKANTRQVCGVVRCTETTSGSESNETTRQLTSFRVYKTRLSGDSTRRHWQQLASLTPRQPVLDRVSDGVRITGQLSAQQATLSLELVKTHDCQESLFSCVAVSRDNQGRTSAKKSLVGKALDSQAEFGPQFVGAGSFRRGIDIDGQSDSVGALAQLVGLKLDWVESRLEDSLNTLENRLEDKVGDLRAALSDKISGLDSNIEARFGTLDTRITSLQNRLEDKLVHLDRRLTEALGETKTANSDNEGICDRLTSKLDGMAFKQDENRKQLDTCVTKVVTLSRSEDNVTENLSNQLATVITSIQFVERNFTSFSDHLVKLETATDQCALTATGEDDRLADLVSSVARLSGTTQDLVSRVNTFSRGYAGGALVPVDEFFDLLGTGKKEWRLAFRGTPYINIQVYAAYMHGTGIPVEVEEGCKQFNRSLPCANHYRNREVFDNWAGIDEVLFAVYKGDQMVHRVIFNGKGSSYTNWFAAGRIIDSSWDDLTTKTHAVFSIFGEKTSSVQRRFFMNFDYDRGCLGFRGWFYAGDLHGGCAAEQTLATPMFKYATGRNLAVWSSQNAARADAIGIFLKY